MRRYTDISTTRIAAFSKAARKAVVCALAALLMMSCHLRPLEVPENLTAVRIEIVTQAITNVTHDVYNDKIPLPELEIEVMHVLFFEYETERFVTEAFISNKYTTDDGRTFIEGDIIIEPGKYKMIVFNFGTITTLIRDLYSWDNIMAYTLPVDDYITHDYKAYQAYRLAQKQAENRKKGNKLTKSDSNGIPYTEAEPADDVFSEVIVEEPDHLFVMKLDEEIIPADTEVHTIDGVANTIVDTYYFQVKIEGAEYVTEAQAFITNLAGGNLLTKGERITDPTNTIYFPLLKSDDNGVPVLCNVFNTFGHLDGFRNDLTITFDLRTKDGNSVMHTFDITDLFYTKEAIEHHWLLLDEVIKVDPPISGGGGMAPEVGEWESENVDIMI